MPIDLQSSVSTCSRWAFGSDALNSILGSSLFVAILISLVMMLLVMIFYPAKPGTGFGIVARMGLYMFFSTLLIVFLHDSVLKYIFEDKAQIANNDDIMRGVTMGGRNPVYGAEYQNVVGGGLSEPAVVHIDGGEDGGSDDDEPSTPEKPAYGGSIVEGGHGVLGGRPPPPKGGNPYS